MKNTWRPGFITPALMLIAAMATASSTPVMAQVTQPPISSQPVPNELELSKLIWSTMVAIDHGNQSGNYSVLRDISAPGFQILNDAAKLAQIFSGIRASRIDLSNTILLAPTYTAPPAIMEPGIMRVQGYFGLRPTAIAFDFYFQWATGKWRLYGVSVQPRTIAAVQPQASPAPKR